MIKCFVIRLFVGAIAYLFAGGANAAIEAEKSGPVSANVRFSIAGAQLWLTIADRAADELFAGEGGLTPATANLSNLARVIRSIEHGDDNGIGSARRAGRTGQSTPGGPFADGHAFGSLAGDFHHQTLAGGRPSFEGPGGVFPGSQWTVDEVTSGAIGNSGGLPLIGVLGPGEFTFTDLSTGSPGRFKPSGYTPPAVPGAPFAVFAPAHPGPTNHSWVSDPPSAVPAAALGALQDLPEPTSIAVWAALAVGGFLVHRRYGSVRSR